MTEEYNASNTKTCFVPYEKMTKQINDTVSRSPTKAEDVHHDEIYYVVTEKIHGANFSILVDETDGVVRVQFARRTAILKDGEDFFGHSAKAQEIEEPAKEIFASWKESQTSQPVGANMTIYGELFGGHYPHDEVATVRRRKPVQRGIWYSPNLEFCAFDVSISMEGRRYYLPFGEARELVELAGLLFVQPLFRGSLKECADMSIVFDSTIPTILGLPPLPAGSNTVEGVVIRSERNFANGERFMMKNKTEAFMEKRNERAPKSHSNSSGSKRGKKQDGGKGLKGEKTGGGKDMKPEGGEDSLEQEDEGHDLNQEALDLKQEAMNMVTMQRLDNVLSKIGRLDASMYAMVESSLYDDVVADVKEEFGSFTPDMETEGALRNACKSVVEKGIAREESYGMDGEEKKEIE